MSRPQAIVTGGSRGIGKATCLELARQGFDIAFTYKSNADAAKVLEKELATLGAKAKGFAADNAESSALQETFEKILAEFPNVEVLVNNAGVSIDALAMRMKLEDFDQLLNTNVRGAFVASQAVMRPMMKARKGAIVFVSSVIGQMGNAGQTGYSTSKAALFGMTKSLAKELGSRGIRVNAVAPGFVETDMTSQLPEASKKAILDQISLGKFGSAEQVAQAIAYLCSPAASYVTGQVLAVNGGLYM